MGRRRPACHSGRWSPMSGTTKVGRLLDGDSRTEWNSQRVQEGGRAAGLLTWGQERYVAGVRLGHRRIHSRLSETAPPSNAPATPTTGRNAGRESAGGLAPTRACWMMRQGRPGCPFRSARNGVRRLPAAPDRAPTPLNGWSIGGTDDPGALDLAALGGPPPSRKLSQLRTERLAPR